MRVKTSVAPRHVASARLKKCTVCDRDITVQGFSKHLTSEEHKRNSQRHSISNGQRNSQQRMMDSFAIVPSTVNAVAGSTSQVSIVNENPVPATHTSENPVYLTGETPLGSLERETAVPWKELEMFCWIMPQLKRLDMCYIGNTSRSTTCNLRKTVPGLCNCGPANSNHGMADIFLTPVDPFFTDSVQPVNFHRRKVAIWFPELFYYHYVKHVPCPNCNESEAQVNCKGWNTGGPRHIYSTEQDFYLLCKQYFCKTCSTSFRGYDEKVLAKLPAFIQSRFPALVHRKSAISKTMAFLLSRQIVKKQSMADFGKMHDETNHNHYWTSHHAYLDASVSRSHAFSSKIKPFGKYEDAKGWRGSTVNPKFLARVYVENSLEELPFKNRFMQSITGDMLRGDHTFKIAAVPMIKNRRVFEAMFTVMNEFCLILGFWMVTSKSLADLSGEFDSLCRRYTLRQILGPFVFFTDNCCADRSYLIRAFPMLKAVSLDGFHLLDRYKISKHHVLYPVFMAFLRDSIYVCSEADMAAARHDLKMKGMTDKQIRELPMRYFINNCNVRREIPSAEIVASRVDAVVKLFAKICPGFINSKILKDHKNIMKHLENGCLSDVKDINYYRVNAKGKYQSVRSTSQLECWHLFVANASAATVASPLMAHCTISDNAGRWNIDRSVAAGQMPDLGTYKVGLLHKIHELRAKNTHRFDHDPLQGFDMAKIDWQAPLENFGCRKVIDKSILKAVADLKNLDGDDSDEVSATLDLQLFANENGDIATMNDPSSEIAQHVEELIASNSSDLVISSSLANSEQSSDFGGECEDVPAELLRALRDYPYPRPFSTEYEVELFAEILKTQMVATKSGHKISFDKFAIEWYNAVLNKYKEAAAKSPGDLKDCVNKFSFKTRGQLQGFKELVDKKIEANHQISAYRDDFKALEHHLEEFTIRPMPAAAFVRSYLPASATSSADENNGNASLSTATGSDIASSSNNATALTQPTSPTQTSTSANMSAALNTGSVDVAGVQQPVAPVQNITASLNSQPASNSSVIITDQPALVSSSVAPLGEHIVLSPTSAIGKSPQMTAWMLQKGISNDYVKWFMDPKIQICRACRMPKTVRNPLTNVVEEVHAHLIKVPRCKATSEDTKRAKQEQGKLKQFIANAPSITLIAE